MHTVSANIRESGAVSSQSTWILDSVSKTDALIEESAIIGCIGHCVPVGTDQEYKVEGTEFDSVRR